MTGLVAGMAAALLTESFFSGTELAMVGADRMRLEGKASAGDRNARRALDMLKREDRVISTCLIGTNLSTVTGTTLMALLVEAQGWSPVLALLYVPLSVILGEALPKTVFQRRATRLAPTLAAPLALAQGLFSPILAITSLWSTALRRLLGASEGGLTREDIVQMLDETTSEIAPEEQRMIRNLFELPEAAIESVMTPLVEVQALPVTATVAEAVALAIRCGHSRIPVYDGRIDNIVGLLRITDLLYDHDDTLIEVLMRPVRFVPETKRAASLLHEMRKNREHFVIVVDEYGGSVGVVTIEDLIEEFVGEIHDERDERVPTVHQLPDGTWRMPGRTELDTLMDLTDLELPEGDYETVAGLLLRHLGRIPKSGEVVRLGGVTFKVEEASDRAIQRVHLTIPPPPERGS